LIAGSIPPAKEKSTTEPWTAATRPDPGEDSNGSTETDTALLG